MYAKLYKPLFFSWDMIHKKNRNGMVHKHILTYDKANPRLINQYKTNHWVSWCHLHKKGFQFGGINMEGIVKPTQLPETSEQHD